MDAHMDATLTIGLWSSNMPRKRELPFESSIFFDPKSERQAQAIETFRKHDLVFLLGPAGTGKTHVAVYLALMEMHEFNTKTRKRVQKIVVTRPCIEAGGERLGALPGEINDKVHPYMLPVYDCVSKIVNGGDAFIKENFDIVPLAYMRGRTFDHCVAVLDEAQNCSISQLKLFMTRLGAGSKMIISGDTDQYDVPKSGLKPWADSLRGAHGIGFVEFTEEDIVRHPLVRTILRRTPKDYN